MLSIMEGDRIGPYRVLRTLGVGGMGGDGLLDEGLMDLGGGEDLLGDMKLDMGGSDFVN